MISALDRVFSSELGAASLDFAATLGHHLGPSPIERLDGPARLAEWFVREGLLSSAPSVSEEHLRQALILREAIFRAVTATAGKRSMAQHDVATINSFAGDEPPQTILQSDGTAVCTSAAPVQAALAAVARDAIDIIAHHRSELHRCEGEACSGVFIDASRGRRRRWCSMSRCGNRAKVTAYRKRSRAS
jgi:predicted RNA-binding Zn ribbon-like protein